MASVSTSGVLPTGMPRSAAASTSMLSVPTAMFAIACSRGAASSSSASTRSVTSVSSASASRARARSSSGPGGRSPGHSSTSCASRRRSSAGNGSCARDEYPGHRRAFCWHGTDPRRLLRLAVRRLARALLPQGPPAAALARALRVGVRHRRGELDLLPARQAAGRRRLGRADAARLRVRRQGEPVPHAHEAPDRHRAGHRALLRRDRAARRLAQARPGAVAAARALHARRAAPGRRARLAAARPARVRVPPPELVRGRRGARAAALARRRAGDRRPSGSGRGSRGSPPPTGHSCASTTAIAGRRGNYSEAELQELAPRVAGAGRRRATSTSTTTGRGSLSRTPCGLRALLS